MLHRDRRLLPTGLALAALLGATGCGGSRSGSAATTTARPVTAEAFADPAARPASSGALAAAPATGVAVGSAPSASAKPPASARAAAAPVPAAPLPPDAVVNTAALIGQPAPADPRAAATEPPVVLEALVGQVNGRPVFASEILEPLDAQLRAAARTAKDRAAWQQEVSKPILDALIRIIKDELILAEARSSLTPEQKQGLFQFLGKIQEDVVSQQRGSAAAADEALRQGSGITLQQAAQDRLDRELIANEVRQRINPRVIVSWRQVQQEYERRSDKYNPRPIAQYRLISAPAKEEARVEKIKAELAAGRPFKEVAESDLSTLARAEGGLIPPVRLTGDPEQTLFQFKELDAAAKPLTEGQFAGPVPLRGFVYWVMLDSIERPPSVSLYDAQLDIERDLRDRRFVTESDRYFDRLRQRGSVSKISDMATRVFAIAEQRYLGPETQQ